jgi:plasmid maintenance system antidote protein VapI
MVFDFFPEKHPLRPFLLRKVGEILDEIGFARRRLSCYAVARPKQVDRNQISRLSPLPLALGLCDGCGFEQYFYRPFFRRFCHIRPPFDNKSLQAKVYHISQISEDKSSARVAFNKAKRILDFPPDLWHNMRNNV